MTLTDLPAPAKLNLFLHITGRREDGYHLLQSVFMLIDWADRLHMERRPNGQLSREDLSTPLPADDLILCAARALQTASGTPWGAHIAIDKQLPAQAGMGGGSSDAATTLLALNRLWELDWPLERLLPLGLALGADVPFFPARAQRLGRRYRRAHPAHLAASGPVCRGQTRSGPGDRTHLSRPGFGAGLQNCYNGRLRCIAYWLWPQRLAACRATHVPRGNGCPSVAHVPRPLASHDRLGQRGVRSLPG